MTAAADRLIEAMKKDERERQKKELAESLTWRGIFGCLGIIALTSLAVFSPVILVVWLIVR